MAINAALLQQIANPEPMKVRSPLETAMNGLQLQNVMQGNQAQQLGIQEKQGQIADTERKRQLSTQLLQGISDAHGDPEEIQKALDRFDPTGMGMDYRKTHADVERMKSERLKADAETAKVNADAVAPLPYKEGEGYLDRKTLKPIVVAEKPRKFESKEGTIDGQPVTALFQSDGPDNEIGKYFVGGTAPENEVKTGTAAGTFRPKEVNQQRKLDAFLEERSQPGSKLVKYPGNEWGMAQAEADRSVAGRIQVTVASQAAKGNFRGDFDKTGDEFLNTIPAQFRATVKKIAQYDEDPTKVTSMRGGMREEMMAWVNQINPGYKETEFKNIGPMRKAFTSGTQGQQINAINTAIGHIDQITKLGADLKNGSFVPGNQLYNWAKTTFGQNAVTNFDTLKDALAGEISSVLSKGSATVSGIAEAKEKIKAASSPQQLAGYVKTLIPVMGSKLVALNDQYQKGTYGNDPNFSALSDESKSVLRKNGFDPENPLGDSSAGSAGSRMTATNPQTGEKIESMDGGKTWRNIQ